jgi:hypothetical protein
MLLLTTTRAYIQTLDVDLPELQLPSTETAVNAASRVYGNVFQPLYRYVRDTIAEDVESITQALQEANPNYATPSVGADAFATGKVARPP